MTAACTVAGTLAAAAAAVAAALPAIFFMSAVAGMMALSAGMRELVTPVWVAELLDGRARNRTFFLVLTHLPQRWLGWSRRWVVC